MKGNAICRSRFLNSMAGGILVTTAVFRPFALTGITPDIPIFFGNTLLSAHVLYSPFRQIIRSNAIRAFRHL
jgi:hypothetical protein